MDIPLPKIVPDVGPGGPAVTAMRGFNALTQSNLDNIIKGVEAEYAPYTQYANAVSKIAYANMLPYQIQATIMSNPYLAYAYQNNPQGFQKMVDQLVGSMPQNGNITGGINIPLPGQGNRGGSFSSSPIARVANYLSGGRLFPQQPQGMPRPSNPMAQGYQDFGAANRAPEPVINKAAGLPENTPPTVPGTTLQQQLGPQAQTTPPQTLPPPPQPGSLSPSTEAPIKGLMAAQTAKYNQQWATPGATATINGKDISVPSGTEVSDLQRAVVGLQTAIPIMKKIANYGKEFLTKGGKYGLWATRINNLIKQYTSIDKIPQSIKDKLGVDNAKLSRYADWQALLKQAPEPLLKAFNLNVSDQATNNLSATLEPLVGEDGEGYAARINREILAMTGDRLPLYQSVLKSGIDLGKAGELPKVEIKTTKPEEARFQLPPFKSKKAFQDWYKAQPKKIQDIVKAYLGGKK